MSIIEDYVTRTEGTCGKGKDVIVIFKYEKERRGSQQDSQEGES